MRKSFFITMVTFSFCVVANETQYGTDFQAQKAFFQEHGYLWIKNFFSAEQIHLLQHWVDQINHEAELTLELPQDTKTALPGALITVPEAANPQQVCRAEDLCTVYPELYHFVRGNITAYISYLLDEPYVLFKDKINFKWPGGGAFPPHQDFPAYENFGPREHVTAMVCIDPATLENGCLQIDGNWRGGSSVLPYITGGKNHGSIDPAHRKEIQWIPLETSPRDLVLFTSYLPHYSEVNNSQKPRRAFLFTHNRQSEGDHRTAYYYMKRTDPQNPVFHFATPTKARDK